MAAAAAAAAGSEALKAAAIQGLSAIGAGYMTSAGSDKATKRMIRYNETMYALQRANYLADREHAEAYDSPAAQKQRLLDAGLNPYLMLQTGDVGSAQSPANISANPGQYSNTLEPVAAGVRSGIDSAVNLLREEKIRQDNSQYISAQTRETNARAEFQEITNQTAMIKNLQEIGMNDAQIRNILLENELKEQLNPINVATAQQQYENLVDQHEINVVETVLKNLQVKQQTTALQYLPAQLQLDIAQREAELIRMSDAHELNRVELSQACEDLARSVQDNAVHKLSEREVQDLRRALYNEALSGAELNTFQNVAGNPLSELDGTRLGTLRQRFRTKLFKAKTALPFVK